MTVKTDELIDPKQIRQRGMSALCHELGPVGAIRFIQLFDRGEGDYTKERHERLAGLTIEDFKRYVEESKAGKK